MEVFHVTVGPFQERTYVLSDPETQTAYVIDPGGWNERVLSYLKKNELHVEAVLSTHGHIDHVAGAYDLCEATQAPYRLSRKDEFLLEDLDRIAAYFSFPNVTKPVVQDSLTERDTLWLGKRKISVIETPGHTPGGVCFLIEDQIFVGDTLFNGSIGRTDLPGGSHEQLIDSIQNKLMALDAETIVHCGHGPDTTIGREKKHNLFLQGAHNAFF